MYTRIGSGNKIPPAGTGQRPGTFKAISAPAFDGAVGLFLNKGKLTAALGGTADWTFSGDGGLDTVPIAVAGTVLFGSSSGMLYGRDINTGPVVWRTNVGAAIPAPAESSSAEPLTGLSAGQGLLITGSRTHQGSDLVALIAARDVGRRLPVASPLATRGTDGMVIARLLWDETPHPFGTCARFFGSPDELLQRLIARTAVGCDLHSSSSAQRFERDTYHGDAPPTELRGQVLSCLTWCFAPPGGQLRS